MSTLSTLRGVLIATSLAVGSSASADQHAAVISVAGCPFITWATDGYALVNQTFEPVNGVENDGAATAVVLCDAELPPDATAFDYAELEYTPGGPDLSPWLVVLRAWRIAEPDGTTESWLQEVGQCGQAAPAGNVFSPMLPTWPPTSPMNICQTQGDVDLTAIEAASPGADGSLVYLVVLPSSPTAYFGGYGTGWAQAFRIVTYYEQ